MAPVAQGTPGLPQDPRTFAERQGLGTWFGLEGGAERAGRAVRGFAWNSMGTSQEVPTPWNSWIGIILINLYVTFYIYQDVKPCEIAWYWIICPRVR